MNAARQLSSGGQRERSAALEAEAEKLRAYLN
jgi:hypothetical protein